MKFRYKVLFTNLILLSVGLGLVCYLMIYKNFELAKQTQLKNAIMQNNLVQSSVEYELLQLLNSEENSTEIDAATIIVYLPQIGNRVSSSVRTKDSFFYIYYDGNKLYTDDKSQKQINESLFNNLTIGNKNYLIEKENEKRYIYVTSQSVIDGNNLCIISKCDASEAYKLLDEQIKYFRWIVVLILLAESIAMYIISCYLTKPLEQLNHVSEEIAQGDYVNRVNVKSEDEIGLLAQKFNTMAQAVSDHVNELNDMVRRREQFVADFTHEIKTPMTSIIGYADTMRSLELPREEQIMALGYIFSEGKRLESMSQKLFELIYLRQNHIEKEKVHMTDLCVEVVKVVEPAFEDKSIKIETKIEDAVLSVNRELMVTALVNIMDNARKASKEEGSVLISGRILDNGYEICITDHGIGMTQEQVGKICDEFYMADKSRARKAGGAGIGMSLVAIILEHHNATLSVESEPGFGTNMRIKL